MYRNNTRQTAGYQVATTEIAKEMTHSSIALLNLRQHGNQNPTSYLCVRPGPHDFKNREITCLTWS